MINLKYYITILLLLCFFTNLKAQDYKRTSWWYFGDKAGLHFTDSGVVADSNSAMSTIEGCATISDTNGNLLFYTNGETVWNKNHQIMENGTGLLGSWDANQPAIIVPQPNNDSIYYIFTTDALGLSNGFRFHTINIKENAGLGKIIEKNILLKTPVCEKLTATHHENGVDIWVVVHGFGNNEFYSYLITENGIANCPIISKVGKTHSNQLITNAQGGMKFSNDGNLLAIVLFVDNEVELFRFDKSKGILYKLFILNLIKNSYSLEFSSNN